MKVLYNDISYPGSEDDGNRRTALVKMWFSAPMTDVQTSPAPLLFGGAVVIFVAMFHANSAPGIEIKVGQ